MTLNQLLVIFRDIATRHKQVHSFKVAQDFNIDAEERLFYPALVVNPTASELPRTENGYTSYSIKFNVQVIDLMNKDRDNEDDVLSDNLTILKEIINEFNTHPYYTDNSIDLIGNISFNPLRGKYDSDTNGWGCEMELQSPNALSFCGSPITNLAGFNFSPASVTVVDGLNQYELFPSDSYTCTPVTPLSGITYQQIPFSGQTTSYNTYDEGWLLANNVFDRTPPTNPIHTAELDYTALDPYNTLKNNNAFGNTNRFTDVNGLQTYGDEYIIDHLYGVGYMEDDTANSTTVPLMLAQIEGETLAGFSDWHMVTMPLLMTIRDFQYSNGYISYSPFAAANTSQLWTSTNRPNSSGNYMYLEGLGRFIPASESLSKKSFRFRVHYT